MMKWDEIHNAEYSFHCNLIKRRLKKELEENYQKKMLEGTKGNQSLKKYRKELLLFNSMISVLRMLTVKPLLTGKQKHTVGFFSQSYVGQVLMTKYHK